MSIPFAIEPALALVVSAAPKDEDVVAGWTAFVVFIALIIAVAVLGVSLTRRLRNVERAAAEGKYDPSSPKKQREREARGLALMREQRAEQEKNQDGAEPPA